MLKINIYIFKVNKIIQKLIIINIFFIKIVDVNGIPELREVIADYHTKKDNIKTSPNQIIVAPGSK